MPAKQPQLEAFSKIVGMLEEAIFNGSTGGSSREFYTIPHPGIFVNPNLTEAPNTKDMLLASEMLNTCFGAKMLYSPLLTSVSQTYSDVLEQAALPDKKLSAAEKNELADAEKTLEALFDSYIKYRDRHDEIVGSLVRAQIAGAPADVIFELERKRKFALEEWKFRGKKLQYENLDAQIGYLRSVSPRLHFQRLKTKFDAFSQTVGPSSYQAIYLDPPISEWSSAYSGWAQFSKVFKYSELHTFSKHSTWSGSVGVDFGVWRAGGGTSGSGKETYENSEDIDIELKFEYMRVKVHRPWLVPDVFAYKFWTYKKAFGYRLISEGFDPGTRDPLGPQGLMPVLPTHIVVAKNVYISAAFSEAEKRFAESTLSGSVSGGWGPFSARGSYSTTTTKQDVVGSFDGTTLRIANPQIIGMMGILLPRTPNPDRRLPWGSDADFGDDVAVSSKRSNLLDRDDYVAELIAQRERVKGIFGEG